MNSFDDIIRHQTRPHDRVSKTFYWTSNVNRASSKFKYCVGIIVPCVPPIRMCVFNLYARVSWNSKQYVIPQEHLAFSVCVCVYWATWNESHLIWILHRISQRVETGYTINIVTKEEKEFVINIRLFARRKKKRLCAYQVICVVAVVVVVVVIVVIVVLSANQFNENKQKQNSAKKNNQLKTKYLYKWVGWCGCTLHPYTNTK